MVLDLEGSHIISDSFYLQISIKGTHLLVARLPALPFPRQIGSGQKLLNVGGIQMRGAQDEKLELVKGTVLERFKEDRNMLKMVGLANASD